MSAGRIYRSSLPSYLAQTQRTFARACSLVLSTSGDFGVPSNNCWEADGWSNYWRGFGMLLIGWISSCFISSYPHRCYLLAELAAVFCSSYPHRLKITCSISTGCTINRINKSPSEIWPSHSGDRKTSSTTILKDHPKTEISQTSVMRNQPTVKSF